MIEKMKALEGIARKHGEERFLNAAGYYTCHVRETVADTIHEMKSRWFDVSRQITEAQKMLEEYNSGNCILSFPPCYVEIDMGEGQSM